MLFFFAGAHSQAQSNIYVNSSTGSDGSGDGSSGNPYQSFYQGYTAASSGDTINLDGTFTWTDAVEIGDAAGSGFTISKNLYVRGAGAQNTIIQANSSKNTADRRIFTISNTYNVGFEKVTLRNGKGSSGGAIMAGSSSSNTGTLEINYCEIVDNISTSNYAGGIYLNGGTLTSRNSTYTGNQALYWGAAIYAYYGLYRLENNTFTGHSNFSVIHCIFGTGDLVYTNNTIAYNTITATYGWAVYNETTGYSIYMQNNLIVENKNASTPRDWSYGGSYSNAKNNMIETAVSGFSDGVDGNVIGTGGSNLQSTLNLNSSLVGTRTLAITSSSAKSVNSGLSTNNGSYSVPSRDQRNAIRAGTMDIGSYEFNGTGLPVELAYFEANLNESNHVDLNWQTLSERDNDHFEIYRSKDGENWTLIHTELGAGNSQEALFYAAEDRDPINGVNYYQLKQIDFNGESEKFDFVRVEVTKDIATVYPNPAKHFIAISNESVAPYQVVDHLGRVHLSGTVEKQGQINIASLPEGSYMLRIESKVYPFQKMP